MPYIQGGIRMAIADQFISEFIQRLHPLILTVKCLGKIFVPLPQSLDVINGAL